MAENMEYLAPAKINPCLHVLKKRSDGYHDLAMLMQPVSLYDRLRITCADGKGVKVTCPGLELNKGDENIAARAVRAILEEAEIECSVTIEIEKNIPAAAGLGGGSSDAATVLEGLNEMLELEFEQSRLMRLGATLGADVPFFLLGATAWATGVGDVLEKVDFMPDLWYVLVNPGVAVSTAWVYGNLRLTSPRLGDKLRRFPGTAEDFVRQLHNDLEPVTMARYPVVGAVKQRLLEAGAIGALMSGSGPTVFGVFRSEESARKAAAAIVAEPRWRVFVVQPLVRKG